MTTYKDTDIREALRRKYADTPQLPSDFLNRMQQAPRSKKQRASTPLHYGQLGSLEQPPNVAAAPQRGANPHSRRRAGWGWVGIAAALLIAFLVWPKSQKETTTQTKVQPVVAEADPQPALQPIFEETKEEVLAEVKPAPQPEKKHRKAVGKQSSPVELVQAGSERSSESLLHQEGSTQSSSGEEINTMRACYDEVDSKTRLYAVEIELEKFTHQRQEACEEEMMQRALKLLLYINKKEDKQIAGSVNTQKS